MFVIDHTEKTATKKLTPPIGYPGTMTTTKMDANEVVLKVPCKFNKLSDRMKIEVLSLIDTLAYYEEYLYNSTIIKIIEATKKQIEDKAYKSRLWREEMGDDVDWDAETDSD